MEAPAVHPIPLAGTSHLGGGCWGAARLKVMALVELRARLPDGPGCRECPGQVGWGGPPVGVPSGPGRPRPAFRSKDQAFAPPRQADEGVGRGPEGRPYGRGGAPPGGLTKWGWGAP